MEKLKITLEQPITFIKISTTGNNPETDRIVEIAFKKITNDGKERQSTTILNPEIPIPKEATDKHGILDETVKWALILQGFQLQTI